MGNMKGWIAVPVKKELYARVKRIVREHRIGYRSITGFINDAIQRRVEELEEKIAKGYIFEVSGR